MKNRGRGWMDLLIAGPARSTSPLCYCELNKPTLYIFRFDARKRGDGILRGLLEKRDISLSRRMSRFSLQSLKRLRERTLHVVARFHLHAPFSVLNSNLYQLIQLANTTTPSLYMSQPSHLVRYGRLRSGTVGLR